MLPLEPRGGELGLLSKVMSPAAAGGHKDGTQPGWSLGPPSLETSSSGNPEAGEHGCHTPSPVRPPRQEGYLGPSRLFPGRKGLLCPQRLLAGGRAAGGWEGVAIPAPRAVINDCAPVEELTQKPRGREEMGKGPATIYRVSTGPPERS